MSAHDQIKTCQLTYISIVGFYLVINIKSYYANTTQRPFCILEYFLLLTSSYRVYTQSHDACTTFLRVVCGEGCCEFCYTGLCKHGLASLVSGQVSPRNHVLIASIVFRKNSKDVSTAEDLLSKFVIKNAKSTNVQTDQPSKLNTEQLQNSFDPHSEPLPNRLTSSYSLSLKRQ